MTFGGDGVMQTARRATASIADPGDDRVHLRKPRPLGCPASAGLLARKPKMLVTVALANKMARIIWALLVKGGTYKTPAAAA